MRWPTPPGAWGAAGASPPRGRAGRGSSSSARSPTRARSTSPPPGATTLPGLAYAGRLGLWAAGETPFETREAFVSAMEAGVAEPSHADYDVTERLANALATVDVQALDHLVVGDGETVSLAERGWL